MSAKTVDLCRANEAAILQPCGYHKGRFAVGFFEQVESTVESCASFRRTPECQTSVKGDENTVELFHRMDGREGLAGHWGLMSAQRFWLQERLSACTMKRPCAQPIRILQCGIAGHVHYFGNVKLLLQVLEGTSRMAELHTIDRCIGPLESIQSMEKIIPHLVDHDFDRGSKPDLNVRGHVVPVPQSVIQLAQSVNLLDERLCHRLTQCDLADAQSGSALPAGNDIVLAHFLFNQWKIDNLGCVKRFARNMKLSTAPGADLLIAVNNDDMLVGNYHEAFAADGFSHVATHDRFVWDIYDVPICMRATFRQTRQSFRITNTGLLVHYVRCSD